MALCQGAFAEASGHWVSTILQRVCHSVALEIADERFKVELCSSGLLTSEQRFASDPANGRKANSSTVAGSRVGQFAPATSDHG